MLVSKCSPRQLIVITPPNDFPKETLWLNRMFDCGIHAVHVRKPGWTEDKLRRYICQISPSNRSKLRIHSHHQLAEVLGLGGVHYPAAILPPTPLQPYCTPEGERFLQSTSFHSLNDLRDCTHYGALDYAFLSPIFDSVSKQGYSAAPFDPALLRTRLQALSRPCQGQQPLTPPTPPAAAQPPPPMHVGNHTPSHLAAASSSQQPHTGGSSDSATDSVSGSGCRSSSGRCGLAVVALGGITRSNMGDALAMGFNGVAVLGSVWKLHGGVTPVTEVQELLQCWGELTGS